MAELKDLLDERRKMVDKKATQYCSAEGLDWEELEAVFDALLCVFNMPVTPPD